ncbi:MAG TPA: HAD-IIIA family hydrolase [Acidimicrobiales bacterium]|nr:HAD-IIIA family hydrolase [Acidimicrobiales bacterium]
MAGLVADAAPFSVVVPTIGRPCLDRLLRSLAAAAGPRPAEVVLVDDRPATVAPLESPAQLDGGVPVRVLRTAGRLGPAAARNVGWRAVRAEWVAFLDDDVVVGPSWYADLALDLEALPASAAASQGRISVPLPADRRPTDWERNVAGLEQACWATADMAYRRDVLEEVGGFDERFPRAYREDSDLGLRVVRAGWLILRGERLTQHPIRPADRWVSVRLQAGNADDVTMRALHGPGWRDHVAAGPDRTGRHVATTASLLVGAAGLVAGRRRLAATGLAAWAALTAEFAWGRVAPGPATARELATMAVTSVVIPPAAVYHSLKGWARVPTLLRNGRDGSPRWTEPALGRASLTSRVRYGPVPRPIRTDPRWAPKAVLFDRDGTLILDRHYLSDPDGVTPLPGTRVAVTRVKRAGLRTAVVTNQSGVGRGLMTRSQMQAVNERVDRVAGPFDWWAVCCHSPEDGCDCRKPAAGLVLQAAQALGVPPSDCAVIGDIGADVEAARAAGARSVLVPTRRTRPAEIRAARQVAPDILTAVDLIVAGRC